MASNQLSLKSRDLLWKRLDHLWGRALLALPCPLNYDERLALAQTNILERDIEAINRVRPLGVLIGVPRVVFTIEGHHYKDEIQFNLYGAMDEDFFGVRNVPTCKRRNMICERLGHPTAHRFFEWLDNAVELSIQIELARLTAQDVMGMVKTAGHLRRMVPELYKLAGSPGVTGRASAVPYEWAAYPRERIAKLTETLAKLSLLQAQPDGDSTEWLWSKREGFTWPLVNVPEKFVT